MTSIPIDTDGGSKVVLELIYRLKVRDVMAREIITASPVSGMREVQLLMRDHGITGIPIAENGRLVGIVTIGDILQALDAGLINEAAGKHMSTSIIVLEEEMPLSFAISYLNRYSFRRFPVLGKDGLLVGIITAADIIRVLLVEMNREVERLEADMAAVRAASGSSPAAPDVISLYFPTRQFDFESAGKASGELKKALKGFSIDPAIIRRAAVASYELELNQVIHSLGGVMEFTVGKGNITIVARDTGPGIPDLEAALTEGFSTANEWIRSIGFGAGLGLPNAKRSANEFDIQSSPAGTTVSVKIIY